jgi:hypothetical protein
MPGNYLIVDVVSLPRGLESLATLLLELQISERYVSFACSFFENKDNPRVPVCSEL